MASGRTGIQVLRPAGGRRFSWALLDFDGTLSLIRTGWQDVMKAMMLEELRPLRHGLSDRDLERLVVEDITVLTGEQTIYQMIRLTERVARFGGSPADPLQYKRRYNARLMDRIADRRKALADGTVRPDDLLLPGARALLEALTHRGLILLLTSGTDQPYVEEEACLLDLPRYFRGRIHGARDDYQVHTKEKVIERMMAEHDRPGAELLGIGDGYVEIAATRQAGGYAVGVASDETRPGRVNRWKRDRLIQAGADLVLPDFADLDALLAALFGPRE